MFVRKSVQILIVLVSLFSLVLPTFAQGTALTAVPHNNNTSLTRIGKATSIVASQVEDTPLSIICHRPYDFNGGEIVVLWNSSYPGVTLYDVSPLTPIAGFPNHTLAIIDQHNWCWDNVAWNKVTILGTNITGFIQAIYIKPQ